MNTESEKTRMRRHIHSLLCRDADGRREESDQITQSVVTLHAWCEATTILAFLSMDDEIDTSLLIREALLSAKTLALPRATPTGLEFRFVDSEAIPWEMHAFGMKEPAKIGPVVDLSDARIYPALIVTPGLAFDPHMGRLGRGKGYYDRFFGAIAVTLGAGSPIGPQISIGRKSGGRVTALGVCSERQIVDRVPTGERDVPVDLVVTGTRIVA